MIRRVALAAAIAAGLALGAVGLLRADSGEQHRSTAAPTPPLSHPIAQTSVPAWLEQIRPHRHGRWVAALPSPDGRTLLAQWLAECEVPFAYVVPVASREPRPVVDRLVESIAVGWSADGRAKVFLPTGTCGTGASRPGLYLVSLNGDRELVDR